MQQEFILTTSEQLKRETMQFCAWPDKKKNIVCKKAPILMCVVT